MSLIGTKNAAAFLLLARQAGPTDFYPARLALAKAENKRCKAPKVPRKKRGR